MGRAAAKSMANSVSSPIKSPEMADLVLEYDNYYGQQCAEAIGARLNYPAFMNIISNPVRMPHRDRTSHWITWILPNIMWYPYTAERRDLIGKYIPRGRGFCPRDCLRLISRAKGCKIPALGKSLGRKEKKHLICDCKLFTIIRGHLFSTQLILRHIPVIFYSSINNFIRFCLFCLSFI